MEQDWFCAVSQNPINTRVYGFAISVMLEILFFLELYFFKRISQESGTHVCTGVHLVWKFANPHHHLHMAFRMIYGHSSLMKPTKCPHRVFTVSKKEISCVYGCPSLAAPGSGFFFLNQNFLWMKKEGGDLPRNTHIVNSGPLCYSSVLVNFQPTQNDAPEGKRRGRPYLLLFLVPPYQYIWVGVLVKSACIVSDSKNSWATVL